ncbi:MAG: glucosidase [Acidobacteria bacterium]|nr:glucosidase [Acidobacteriota bacterium]
MDPTDAEWQRLDEDRRRVRNWRKWGPYLAERQWGTVREDYSADGRCWDYFPHDHARSRAYRWGEDGIFGISDRECRLCFALALWNGHDPILKERFFGLANEEGNHGEDVKELYYFLDATPTASYLKALYKYPLDAFPYEQLVENNRRRGQHEPEFEIEDTDVIRTSRYADVIVEYAKAGVDDLLIRITCTNRSSSEGTLHILPTLWLRNTWSWGRTGEGYWPEGVITRSADDRLVVDHASLGRYVLCVDACGGTAPTFLFTDNETNAARLFSAPNTRPFTKDAFHRHVVNGDRTAVNPALRGTKSAAWYVVALPAGGSCTLKLRLTPEAACPATPFDASFDNTFAARIAEADAFHLRSRNAPLTDDERLIARQADAGLVWTRQFYHYIVDHWLDGDPSFPPPPRERRWVRNAPWTHVYARDIVSMPDTWEYPWFAAWDLAFHCVAMARVDPDFAKRQLVLLCREWYMHPNGQLPAYEFEFGDANPPVHAWAALRVYELCAGQGLGKDRLFLESVFQKCLVNFTWWVNRRDDEGDNLFSGGFLGLDNIGVFDRSKPLPGGARLEQADATAWMAFYCTTMLAIALELAREDEAYADIASKFFEHFAAITQAMNELGGTGLWDEDEGFYYDQAHLNGQTVPVRIRSMVGLVPLFAAHVIDAQDLERLPLFRARLEWFLANRPSLGRHIAFHAGENGAGRYLLAVPTRDRLERVLRRALDEREFLSPFGLRSLSRIHGETPGSLQLDGIRYEVRYAPGESESRMFGGNSNWRGPVWMPMNYLLAEALKRHHHFYGDTLTVECPVASGQRLDLLQVAEELERRMAVPFMRDVDGTRACDGGNRLYATDPHFRDLVLFHEYFHGETGRGLGASHQTGWTALVANVLERIAFAREARTLG